MINNVVLLFEWQIRPSNNQAGEKTEENGIRLPWKQKAVTVYFSIKQLPPSGFTKRSRRIDHNPVAQEIAGSGEDALDSPSGRGSQLAADSTDRWAAVHPIPRGQTASEMTCGHLLFGVSRPFH